MKATEQYFPVSGAVYYAVQGGHLHHTRPACFYTNHVFFPICFHIIKIPDRALSVRRSSPQYRKSCGWLQGVQRLGKEQVLEMGIDTPADCDVCP